MNPETTLTHSQIALICRQHGISYVSGQRITTGFNNEIHLINDSVILKVCSRAENIESFKTESILLESKIDFKKPKLIASDFSKKIIPNPYILMEYVEGQSLGFIWHLLDNLVRKNLVREICQTLKDINSIEPSVISPIQEKWGNSTVNNFTKIGENLVENNIITKEKFEEILEILEKHKDQLNASAVGTVYWDIHFDNFIVKDGKLAAMIDFESVGITSIDYPLFVIRRMVEEPLRYLAEENEQYADKKDYEQLEEWYREYYPEMFEFEDLESRIAIYRMLNTLHLLKDWSEQSPELYDDLKRFMQEAA